MQSSTDKVFTDPVHGFISVPNPEILELVQTPVVQRLRRIRQLGLGHFVYPGAEHSRFGHALGAMALMRDALDSLMKKGAPVSPEEYNAALAAALLHDIGHGPFSHTLEHTLINDFNHEAMSRLLIVELARKLGGFLNLTLKMFDDTYERKFFHRLVTSQLDMDRLDYLRRDSFYTGVAEGKIGVPRIIQSLRVHGQDEELVVEKKGIYAVESFLIARRLMYWQVYLHKTVIAGDQLLRSILGRARDLIAAGSDVGQKASAPLVFFLSAEIRRDDLNRSEVVEQYCSLDDTDILYSIKQWTNCSDSVLADLCRRFLSRRFPRVTFLDENPSTESVKRISEKVDKWLVGTVGVSHTAAAEVRPYYLTVGISQHAAYKSNYQSIRVLGSSGVRELSAIADSPSVTALTEFEEKPYICAPKISGLYSAS